MLQCTKLACLLTVRLQLGFVFLTRTGSILHFLYLWTFQTNTASNVLWFLIQNLVKKLGKLLLIHPQDKNAVWRVREPEANKKPKRRPTRASVSTAKPQQMEESWRLEHWVDSRDAKDNKTSKLIRFTSWTLHMYCHWIKRGCYSEGRNVGFHNLLSKLNHFPTTFIDFEADTSLILPAHLRNLCITLIIWQLYTLYTIFYLLNHCFYTLKWIKISLPLFWTVTCYIYSTCNANDCWSCIITELHQPRCLADLRRIISLLYICRPRDISHTMEFSLVLVICVQRMVWCGSCCCAVISETQVFFSSESKSDYQLVKSAAFHLILQCVWSPSLS